MHLKKLFVNYRKRGPGWTLERFGALYRTGSFVCRVSSGSSKKSLNDLFFTFWVSFSCVGVLECSVIMAQCRAYACFL